MAITLDGTTGISSVDGSAASPSVRGADSNSGIVYAADEVKISTGGTERAKVNSSGHFLPGAADTYDIGANTTPWRNMWMQNDLYIEDNGMAVFGTGEDLKIFHNGTDSKITNTVGKLDITSSANDVMFYTDQIQFKNAAGSESMAWFEADGACALKFNNGTKIQTNSGGITVTGTVTETSDIALKEDIKPLSNSLSNLKQLNGYSYKFKETGIKALGLTAQDVEKVYPDLVSGEEGQKGLNYSGLIAPLIEAVKELSTEIETLKTKVAALEAA